jgi:hypothetical protein
MKIRAALLAFLIVSCQTDSFDFDKLSTQTGLAPEVQFPLGTIEFQAQTFLDDLDFMVDQDRDVYGTIYLKDTISNIASLGVDDIYDVNTLSSDFNTTYTIEPVEIADFQTGLDPIYVSQEAQLPDGQLIFIPPFPVPLQYQDTALLFEESFSNVVFASGSLDVTITNFTPIYLELNFALKNADGNQIFQFGPLGLNSGNNYVHTIDLEGVDVSQTITMDVTLDSPGSGSSLVPIDHSNDMVAMNLSLIDASVSEATLSADRTFEYSFSKNVSFDSEDDVSLRQLNLQEARFLLEVENQLGFGANLSIKSTESFVDNNSLEKIFFLTPSPYVQNFHWEMNDVELNFTENPSSGASEMLLDFDVDFTLKSGQIIRTNQGFLLSGLFENLVLDTAFGDFGVLEEISEEFISVQSDLDDLTGKVRFVEPKIDLFVYNSFGLPAKLRTEISAQRKDLSSLDFVVDPSLETRFIEAPTAVFDTATTRLTYDANNSNIDDLLAFMPDDQIHAKVYFTTNPPELAYGENFITSKSEFRLDAEIETPAHFNIDNFAIQDTLSFSKPILSGQNAEKITEAKMYINYTSSLPLELNLEMEIIDSQTQMLYTTLPSVLINPAPTNDNGEVVGSNQNIITLTFDSEQITALQNGDAIALNITTSSTEKETKNVKISANASLSFDVSVAVKIDLDE